METRRGRTGIIALWAMCVAWLALITWESSQTGVDTVNTSYRIAELIASLLRLSAGAIASVDKLLRTAMHFVNFFVLGGLAYAASRATWRGAKRVAFWVTGVCCVIAVMDEVKKLWIDGRHLSWPEAGLNCAGVLAGVLLLILFFRWKERRKRRANP